MDLIEEAFLDIHQGSFSLFSIQIGKRRHPEDLAYYFKRYKDFHPVEKALLNAAQGKICDAAAGPGRIALYLQGKSHKVVCLDASLVMKLIGRERGCRHYETEDLLKEKEETPCFDTVTFFGNSLGFCRNAGDVAFVLRRLSRKLFPGGVLLLSVTDPLLFGLNRSRQLSFLQHYKGRTQKGAWFCATPALIRESLPDEMEEEALFYEKGLYGFLMRKKR
jgi:SAM-dependent methyltransferase